MPATPPPGHDPGDQYVPPPVRPSRWWSRLSPFALMRIGIGVVVVVGGLVYAMLTTAHRDGDGQITSAGTVSATEIKLGDCMNPPDAETVTDVPAVPCAQPHQGEVFALVDVPDGPFPGNNEVGDLADCGGRLSAYSARAANDEHMQLTLITPSADTWKTGDRQVVCIVEPETGLTSGSVKDQ